MSSGLSIAKSIGHHGHWGYSAPFDVIEAIEHNDGRMSAAEFNSSSTEPINILLIQPGDIRHIISTIAKRKLHNSSRPIHFYLLENPVEVLARDLTLLELLSDYSMPIRQRATVFLEVYGNCKVQRRTSEYIEKLGEKLRALMATGKGTLHNILDFSLLRYRERDDLERAFRLYARNVAFDMNALLDSRYRALYEERYDSRKSLGDWDYHHTLKSRGSIIHIKQFKEWRISGLAFEFGDQSYTEPNRTLMSYAEGTMKSGKEKGIKKEVKGFWGDVNSSPFAAYGTDCETPNKHSEGLWEILNKGTGTEQHRHHSVEIALYNLFSYLWELETSSTYAMTRANDIYSGLGDEAKWIEFGIHDTEVDGGLSALTDGAEEEEEETGKNKGKEKGAAAALGTIKEEASSDEDKPEANATDSNEKKENEEVATADAGDKKDVDTNETPSPPTTAPVAIPAPTVSVKEKRTKEIFRAIQRSESIVEHYDNVKVREERGALETYVGFSYKQCTSLCVCLSIFSSLHSLLVFSFL